MDKIRYLTEKIENLLTLFPCVAVIGYRQVALGLFFLQQKTRSQYGGVNVYSPDIVCGQMLTKNIIQIPVQYI